MSAERVTRWPRLMVLALVLGATNALVFLGFEWGVEHGTDWIWNDVADSDAVRWRVVPLAILLSVALSALLRLLREPRWTPPHVDPLASAEGAPGEPAPPPAAMALIATLAIGTASMLAGASLGPEAPLMGFAAGLGTWVATRGNGGGDARGPLLLASVGALLVSFFGSLVPLLIPLLLLVRRRVPGRLPVAAAAAVVAAGLAAWATLRIVHGNEHGFGEIPPDAIHARDYATALVLGVVAAGVGALLRWFLAGLSLVAKRIQDGTRWWVAAVVFGAVLGGLYLAGGESVQFTGADGPAVLTGHEPPYGTWALAGIAVVKLLATSWSLSAGYRGGLVFPSVFAGVCVSLVVAGTLPAFAGPGVLLGSVAGLLVETTAPALGVVLLLALLPAKLIPVGLAGALGAIAGRRLLTRPR
jgi:H+/Cl- antiporter ClcA